MLENILEKEKMPVSGIFSFSHNIFKGHLLLGGCNTELFGMGQNKHRKILITGGLNLFSHYHQLHTARYQHTTYFTL